MVRWMLMCSFSLSTPRVVMAVAACSALFVIALPSATAAPATDDQGYVDSTARCAPPSAVVVFGSTDTSRVAICRTPGGQYEYRGVRIRDGAKLIAPASKSGDGEYVADNNGISYTVTANSLIVSRGNQTIREERMVDFHAPESSPRFAARSAARGADDHDPDDAVATTVACRGGWRRVSRRSSAHQR